MLSLWTQWTLSPHILDTIDSLLLYVPVWTRDQLTLNRKVEGSSSSGVIQFSLKLIFHLRWLADDNP